MSPSPLQEEGGFHRDLGTGGVHDPGPSRSQRNPPHLNLPPPSLKMIIEIGTMVGAIFGFLWNFNYDNKVVNDLFHQHPRTYDSIVIIGAVIFFVCFNWLMMRLGSVTHLMDRYFALAVALLILLAITLILNAMLPNKYSWIVWIFFAVTVWITSVMQGWTDKIRTLVMEGCECAIRWTDKIRMLVMQGCECATRWKDRIRRLVVERYKRATQWTDKISLF